MALNYEFDVFSVTADKRPSAPVMREMLTELDLKMENKIARFRSHATVEALQAADRRVRGIFRTAGFEVDPSVRNPKDKLFVDQEAHAVFLVRVTDGIEKTFSEKELDNDDILALPSIDAAYDECIEPDGAFVVLDWLNDTIAMHEMADGDIGEDDEFDDDVDDLELSQEVAAEPVAAPEEAASVQAEPDVLALSPADATVRRGVAGEIRKYKLLSDPAEAKSPAEVRDTPETFDLGVLETEMADVMAKESDAPQAEVAAETVEATKPAAPATRFTIIPSAFVAKADDDEAADTEIMDGFAESDLGLALMADNHELEVPQEQIDQTCDERNETDVLEVQARAIEKPAAPALHFEDGARRPRKPVSARRVRVLDLEQIEAAKDSQNDAHTDDAITALVPHAAQIAPRGMSFLARLNSPAMGVLAGVVFSGAGILAISQVLA
ncbi:hypothetical protein [Roseobacter sp. N2S]|uniref:hypothetical protein n=1 Tax=Roseobacter sp. N2S TaxID=2663844 RepID=UPI00285E983F|nr:hypothetical protein [Roseobacter sp. N2S]MDR6263636.1 hypothetical protein [Roseobacter sp. N2S]